MSNSQFVANQNTMIDRANRYIQRTILKSTGLVLDEGGVCSGLVALYIINNGKGEKKVFFSDKKKLSQLSYEDYKKESGWLGNFIGKTLFAFNPNLYNKKIAQGDIDLIYANQTDAFVCSARLGMVIDSNRLTEFLAQNMVENEGVFLSANKHAIGLYKKNSQFYLYDPNFNDEDKKDVHMNEDGEKVYDSIEEFSQEVAKCIFVRPDDATIDIHFQSFGYVPDKSNLPLIHDQSLNSLQFISSQDVDCNQTFYRSVRVRNHAIAHHLLTNTNCDPFKKYDKASAMDLACTYNLLEIVENVIKHRAINFDQWFSAIKYALTNNSKETSNFLIDYALQLSPAEFKSKIPELFLKACSGSDPEVLEKLIQMNPNLFSKAFKGTALYDKYFFSKAIKKAIKYDNHKVIDYLMQNFGDKIDVMHALNIAIYYGHNNCYTKLAKYCTNQPSEEQLKYAVQMNRKRIAGEIILAGVKPNIDHIKIAIKNHNVEMLTLLLSHLKKSVNVDIINNNTDPTEIELIITTIAGDKTSLMRLLGQTNDNRFAEDLLFIAILSRNIILVRMLIEQNVKIATDNKVAFEQLITACEEKDDVLATLLIAAGVNPNQRIKEGKYAGLLPITMDLEDKEFIIKLLRESKTLDENFAQVLLFQGLLDENFELLEQIARLCKDVPEFFNLKFEEFSPLMFVLAHTSSTADKKFKRYELITFLVAHGANPANLPHEGRDLLVELCRANQPKALDAVLTTSPQMLKPLIEASKARDRLLSNLIEQGKVDILNILMKHGYVLPYEDYLDKLYQAYQCDTIPVSERTHVQLLQFAALNGHGGIMQFILDQKKYLEELDASPRPTKEVQIFNFMPSPIKPSDVKQNSRKHRNDGNNNNTVSDYSLFPNLQQVLIKACVDGNYHLVSYLIERKKVSLDFDGHKPLDVAGSCGHKELVEYFIAKLKPEQLKAKLLSVASEKNALLLAAMLEAIPPGQLSNEDLRIFEPLKGEIFLSYQQLFLEMGKLKRKKPDADKRINDINEDKNALGIFLHQTVKAEYKLK